MSDDLSGAVLLAALDQSATAYYSFLDELTRAATELFEEEDPDPIVVTSFLVKHLQQQLEEHYNDFGAAIVMTALLVVREARRRAGKEGNLEGFEPA